MSFASASQRTLVLGGARSGKSRYAERLLSAEPNVTYVATGGERPDDDEWQRRIALHRAQRPAAWHTVETTELVPLLRTPPSPVLLVEDLTLWLTAVLDETSAWDGDVSAAHGRIDDLLAAWAECPARVVAVSNEVGSGIVPATPSGRIFRDELGRLNAAVAERSDEVLLVVAGRALRLEAADA